jgi:hypothetical protein
MPEFQSLLHETAFKMMSNQRQSCLLHNETSSIVRSSFQLVFHELNMSRDICLTFVMELKHRMSQSRVQYIKKYPDEQGVCEIR